jgi:hypothetical protein
LGYFRPPYNVVTCDFNHAMVQTWQRALDAGYRRIGVALLQEMDAVDLFDKVSAALYCQARLSPGATSIPVQHFPVECRDQLRDWVGRYKPDVVIGFNDAVHWWLRSIRIFAPRDIGFVSLDTETQKDEDGHLLTGMYPDYALIGGTSVHQLDILLRTNQQGKPARPLTVYVPSVWLEGATMPVKPAVALRSKALVS